MPNEIYDKAVHLAATHFLSKLPENAKASEIFDALNAEKLPDGYLLWGKFQDVSELSDLIQNLADDIIWFAKESSKTL